MIPQALAVVGGEQDQGVFQVQQFAGTVEQVPDVVVDEGDLGVIPIAQREEPLRVADFELLEEVPSKHVG
jgi:predicted fused transcriptional regulator/phosphomethylpyrimidine kinase